MSDLLKALDFLKREISRNKEKLKTGDGLNGYGKASLEKINRFFFQRGLDLISSSKDDESYPDTEAWFRGEILERPDLAMIKHRFEQEERIEQEAHESWKGLMKFWLWKWKEKIRCWYR